MGYPWRAGAVVSTIVILAAGCAGDGKQESKVATEGSSEKKLAVVAAFYPLAEIATRVGGSAVVVTNLTAAGVEPHDLELSSRQVEELEDADLVLLMGRGFQPAVEEVGTRRQAGVLSVLDVLSVGEGQVEEEEAQEEPATGEGGRSALSTTTGADGEVLDPHVWLDPVMMGGVVDKVAAALAELAPGDAEMFKANATKLNEDLRTLDERYRAGLEKCQRRTIVTAHEAFGRLATRYGLQQEGIAGFSPDAEPKPARLAELADLVKSQGITTIFTEEFVSPKVAETLAREAKVRTDVLNPLEGLTQGELDAGKDYFDVMDENLQTLRAALACS